MIVDQQHTGWPIARAVDRHLSVEAQRKEREAAIATLEEAGVPILDSRGRWDATAFGTYPGLMPGDPLAHVGRPWLAAFVGHAGDIDYYCTDIDAAAADGVVPIPRPADPTLPLDVEETPQQAARSRMRVAVDEARDARLEACRRIVAKPPELKVVVEHLVRQLLVDGYYEIGGVFDDLVGIPTGDEGRQELAGNLGKKGHRTPAQVAVAMALECGEPSRLENLADEVPAIERELFARHLEFLRRWAAYDPAEVEQAAALGEDLVALFRETTDQP